jgi:acetyl-CoA/propionyl-CoA carboxylase biotin carboxyl carrier protein
VRVDSGVRAGDEISGLYDPLIAKLIVHGVDREHARRRMLRALEEFVVEGPPTLIGFHRALLDHPCFAAGATCHGVVESPELAEQADELSHRQTTLAASSDGVRPTRPLPVPVELDGRRFEVRVQVAEPPWAELARARAQRAAGPGASAGGAVVSPMQGTVLKVDVAEGETIEAGRVICVIEAMKMENEIAAQTAGVVRRLVAAPGLAVTSGQVLCVVEAGD